MPMSPLPNCAVSDSLPLPAGSPSSVTIVVLLPPPPQAASNAASEVPPPTAMKFRRDTESSCCMVRLPDSWLLALQYAVARVADQRRVVLLDEDQDHGADAEEDGDRGEDPHRAQRGAVLLGDADLGVQGRDAAGAEDDQGDAVEAEADADHEVRPAGRVRGED